MSWREGAAAFPGSNVGGKINNLKRVPYFQGADQNKDAFFREHLFVIFSAKRYSARQSGHQPIFRLFLTGGYPPLSTAYGTVYSISDLIFYKKTTRWRALARIQCHSVQLNSNSVGPIFLQQQKIVPRTICGVTVRRTRITSRL